MDLTQRLRERYGEIACTGGDAYLHGKAADELDRLSAELAQARQEAERLRKALRECLDDLIGWAGYASDYFQTKHDLAGDIVRYEAIIARAALAPEQSEATDTARLDWLEKRCKSLQRINIDLTESQTVRAAIDLAMERAMQGNTDKT